MHLKHLNGKWNEGGEKSIECNKIVQSSTFHGTIEQEQNSLESSALWYRVVPR